MTTTGTIDYETLAQDAMRGVVARILKSTEQLGLPGEHHFYISFDTNATGVNISKRLRQQYPDVMTIVLQHRFWDLKVGDDGFEVKLTFDNIPERLVVPYKSIKVFFDPSVRYALQFDGPEFDASGQPMPAQRDEPSPRTRPSERSLTPVEPRPIATFDRKPPRPASLVVPFSADSVRDDADQADAESDNSDDAAAAKDARPDNTVRLSPLAARRRDADDFEVALATDDNESETLLDLDAELGDDDAEAAKTSEATSGTGSSADGGKDKASAVVVSLDAFRKK